ncbi:MAG: hypothetical protein NTW03_01875 [Verrucomicrobia bacterium]|nr:hypothetical protein [Verrucomicrobiota bacterium]
MKAKSIQSLRKAKSKTVEAKSTPNKKASETYSAAWKVTKKKIGPESESPPPMPETLPSLQARTTTIEVKVDVGMGNEVFIRGEGAGLSWDKGELLHCVDRSTWTWSTAKAQDKLVYKILVNDRVWSQGENLIAETGKKTEVAPAF